MNPFPTNRTAAKLFQDIKSLWCGIFLSFPRELSAERTLDVVNFLSNLKSLILNCRNACPVKEEVMKLWLQQVIVSFMCFIIPGRRSVLGE